MIWLSWRQFRGQALVGGILLAVVAAYLVMTGLDIRASYDHYLSQCQAGGPCLDALSRFQDDYRTQMLFLALLLAVVPALLGVFWGAPLIARELEAGTHRLVWNQSVTRRHWLFVKLAFVGLASVLAAAVVSLLLTWAASPFDQVADDRFSTLIFGARNIAPIAYAGLAFVLGAITGMVVRRTIVAMAVTILLFALLQIFVPNVVRPHLMVPMHSTLVMTTDGIDMGKGLGGVSNEPIVQGLTIPDGWITDLSPLLRADGQPLDSGTFNDCLLRAPKTGATGTFGDSSVCLGKLNLHIDIAYQPSDRYWAFQWLETGLYLVLAGLLVAFGLWRVRRQLN